MGLGGGAVINTTPHCSSRLVLIWDQKQSHWFNYTSVDIVNESQ